MPDGRHFIVVGAGLTGAVVARELAEAGHRIDVLDKRDHVAGNCHTERDPGTGVMVHVYGPHIFHTADEEVWDYVRKFGRFRDYHHRVHSTVGGRVYSLPVNLLTINQYFGTSLSPREAEAMIDNRAAPFRTGAPPRNFEEQALSMIGPELYEAFFKGYTEKQWGRQARDLPASIFRRLPLRFTYDAGYFAHPYQGIPEAGYTALVEAMLDHRSITVETGVNATSDDMRAAVGRGSHVIWSGPIDEWFGRDAGRLGYRTLDFERLETSGGGLGCAVMNFGDRDVPWTRITDHGEFASWETADGSVLVRETPRDFREGDIEFYPIRLAEETRLLRTYVDRARACRGITFAGRLGTYRYLDMDASIREALDVAARIISATEAGTPAPVFSAPPLG